MYVFVCVFMFACVCDLERGLTSHQAGKQARLLVMHMYPLSKIHHRQDERTGGAAAVTEISTALNARRPPVLTRAEGKHQLLLPITINQFFWKLSQQYVGVDALNIIIGQHG